MLFKLSDFNFVCISPLCLRATCSACLTRLDLVAHTIDGECYNYVIFSILSVSSHLHNDKLSSFHTDT